MTEPTQRHIPEQPSQQVPDQETEPKKPRRPSALESFFGQVISGNFLVRPEVRRQYPYILILAVLMFLYIANGYYIQKLHRKNERLTDEIKELKSQSLTLASKRMTETRQSEIIKELEKRGIPLIEATEPPHIIER